MSRSRSETAIGDMVYIRYIDANGSWEADIRETVGWLILQDVRAVKILSDRVWNGKNSLKDGKVIMRKSIIAMEKLALGGP